MADALLNGVTIALFRLHRQQCFQIPNVAALFLDRLLREPHEVRPDDRHAQHLANTASRWRVPKLAWSGSSRHLSTRGGEAEEVGRTPASGEADGRSVRVRSTR